MKGLMQEMPLTLDMVLRRARDLGGEVEVVSPSSPTLDRLSWSAVAERAQRLAGALDGLGIEPGERVGTLSWNTRAHLELYLGIPTSGRVLHTANARLDADELAYVFEHAGDRVVFVDASLTPALAAVRNRLRLDHVVVVDDAADADPAFDGSPRYEELVAAAAPADLPALAEDDAASISSTSGTTGRPKAVAYSHRSIVLHTMQLLMRDAHAIGRDDVVLPFTPMFHVNCWGLPYASAMAPAKLVLPGRDVSPEHGGELIERERVTVAAGVPTVWVRLAELLEAGERDLGSLERVLSGGAEAASTLIDRYRKRGIGFFHAWGATEMSPSGTGQLLAPDAAAATDKWGPPTPGVEVRIVGEEGDQRPWDGAAAGELEVRGPWVTAAYLDPDDESNERRFTADGWFRTGDIATITPAGRVHIVDRAKDLVKSGGEWIPSIGLESAIVAHPAIAEAAVIGVPHEEWGERPAALVVLEPGAQLDEDDLRAFLAERVARWWLPDAVDVVGELPKTGVGKYDKRRLRAKHADRLAQRPIGAAR
jgi:fatty-acyl-CoA synthase